MGERRAVTGRERGEKAAAEATNKHAMRMVPREFAAEQQATLVLIIEIWLAHSKTLNLAKI